MGNLERFIPEESETVKRIYAFHEAMENGKPLRKGRMGASVMGKPCERFLWYYFRKLFVKTFSGRMLRLFETGHLEEPRMIRELRGIGCTVHDKDESTGGQFEFTALGGHVVAYPDAVVLGVPEAPKTWHIGEFKTMGGTETQKSKDFEKVQKEGVKVAKPEHHGQMQICMGLGKLTRAIYLTKKKATDELYSERIKYDPVDFKRIMDRAERVIRSSHPAERCATRPDSFSCKFCDAFELCWGTGMSAVPLPRKTCRSCCHATPQIDEGETWARWSCEKHGRDLSPEDQRNACTDHLLLPGHVRRGDRRWRQLDRVHESRRQGCMGSRCRPGGDVEHRRAHADARTARRREGRRGRQGNLRRERSRSRTVPHRTVLAAGVLFAMGGRTNRRGVDRRVSSSKGRPRAGRWRRVDALGRDRQRRARGR